MSSIQEQVRARNSVVVRKGLLAVLAGGVVAVLLAGLFAGRDGVLGALVGLALVLVFYGSDVVLMRWTAPMDPVYVFGIVVMAYMLKLTLLVFFLVGLRGTDAFSVNAFAATVVGETLVGIVVAMWLSARTTTFVEPRSDEPDDDGPDEPGTEA
jgi:ATP synthase protein I